MKRQLFNFVLASLWLSTSLNAQITLDSTLIDTATIAKDLFIPWELLWGPDDYIWFTEIQGKIGKLHPETKERTYILDNIPDLWYDDPTPAENMSTGLFSMVLHPDFDITPYVYVYYTTYTDAAWVKIVRYTYDNATNQLSSPFTLIENIPATQSFHNSGRMLITPEKKLLLSTGDISEPPTAQDKASLNGKILRMNLDGSIPEDNPDPDSYVYTIGHRHAQGLVYSPDSSIIYSSEHGPDTDDEFNIITANGNYGWPNVKGICDTDQENDFCTDNNVTVPVKHWDNIIAPCGIDYYNSDIIPEWKRSILLMTLKERDVRVLGLSGNGLSVTKEEIFFDNEQGFGRLRDVCVSPEGDIYVATTNKDDNGRFIPESYGFPDYDRIIRIANIAPRALEATIDSSGVVNISWKDRWNKEKGFQLFRSKENETEFELLATLEADLTNYLDQPDLPGTYFYKILTFNDEITSEESNTTSVVIDEEPTPPDTTDTVRIKLKVLLEGFWNPEIERMRTDLGKNDLLPANQTFNLEPFNYEGTETYDSLAPNWVDWILVELRDPQNKRQVVAKQAAMLGQSGIVRSLKNEDFITFANVPEGPYWVAIHHKSHLAILSARTIIFDEDPAPLYDFTKSDIMVSGNDQLNEIDGTYFMIGGDYDQNNIVNNKDFNLWSLNAATINMYIAVDGTGNTIVNNSDFNLWKSNVSKLGNLDLEK